MSGVVWLDTCPTCEGLGMVDHSEWNRFWGDADWKDESQPTREIAEEFFGTKNLPPREVVCPTCEGERNIRRTGVV